MKYTYATTGTCSKQINIELDGDTVKEVEFVGGCSGNARGLSELIKGMNKNDVIKKLKGTKCGNRLTSCPDQLALALESAEENH